MILIAILFPALSFLLRGKIFAAIIAFILQLTIIGWLPVAIWAVISRSNAQSEKRFRRMEQKFNSQKIKNYEK